MNNFPVQHEGKTYWISRHVAVTCFVFAPVNGEWCVLANKRGSNTPDFQGYWNCPCGYLDFNETTAQAAMREVYEETGVVLNKVSLWYISDKPDENRQNIVFRYYAILPKACELNKDSNARGGEQNEVEDCDWIPIRMLPLYKMAFDHDTLADKLSRELKLI